MTTKPARTPETDGEDRDLTDLEIALDPKTIALDHLFETLEERIAGLESLPPPNLTDYSPPPFPTTPRKAKNAATRSSQTPPDLCPPDTLPRTQPLPTDVTRESMEVEQLATAMFPHVFSREASRTRAASPFSRLIAARAEAIEVSRRILSDIRAQRYENPLADSSTSEMLVHDARHVERMDPSIASRMRLVARSIADGMIGVGAGRLDYRPGPRDRL